MNSLQADGRGYFTLKVYEGLYYKVSAYSRNATGAVPQSEWVDVPQTPDAKPIKLVLPALTKRWEIFFQRIVRAASCKNRQYSSASREPASGDHGAKSLSSAWT